MKLTKNDVMNIEDYAKNRETIRANLRELKSKRSISIGPDSRFMFESYETLRGQIQEMLYIEGGGEAQAEEELEAYGPLVPRGSNLTATLFFEIPNPEIRAQKLAAWGNIEKAIFLGVDGEKIYASSADELERTNSQGKTSAVHFLIFDLTQDQKNNFAEKEIVLGFDFEKYPHQAVLSKDMKVELERDFS